MNESPKGTETYRATTQTANRIDPHCTHPLQDYGDLTLSPPTAPSAQDGNNTTNLFSPNSSLISVESSTAIASDDTHDDGDVHNPASTIEEWRHQKKSTSMVPTSKYGTYLLV